MAEDVIEEGMLSLFSGSDRVPCSAALRLLSIVFEVEEDDMIMSGREDKLKP